MPRSVQLSLQPNSEKTFIIDSLLAPYRVYWFFTAFFTLFTVCFVCVCVCMWTNSLSLVVFFFQLYLFYLELVCDGEESGSCYDKYSTKVEIIINSYGCTEIRYLGLKFSYWTLREERELWKVNTYSVHNSFDEVFGVNEFPKQLVWWFLIVASTLLLSLSLTHSLFSSHNEFQFLLFQLKYSFSSEW